jgi:hypothetical protein
MSIAMQGHLLKQEEAFLPICMPKQWSTHCCRCHTPAPETGVTGTTSTVGCRCLMCPGWYACLACSEKEAAAHREAHPKGLHFTYCVTAEDEQAALYDKSAAPISAWKFVFESLILPFFKMFIPTIAVFVQVIFAQLARECAFSPASFVRRPQYLHWAQPLSVAKTLKSAMLLAFRF